MIVNIGHLLLELSTFSISFQIWFSCCKCKLKADSAGSRTLNPPWNCLILWETKEMFCDDNSNPLQALPTV